MDEEVWISVEKIMKRLKPFIALAILIFIVISTIHLINYNKLQKEIKLTCGYERSDKVFCVCDKNIVSTVNIPGNPYFDSNSSIENLNISQSAG